MRKTKFAQGEHYHIFNRGNNKQNIFLNDRDYARFLFLILHLQSENVFTNISYSISYFIKHRVFIKIKNENKFSKNKVVNLISFTLMPNHFHMILEELAKDGISNYMQRIQNAYTKYFNDKYDKIGHLLQGPFKDVHIENNGQLLYLSCYVHKNPKELKSWRSKEYLYEWSSYWDYIKGNRWGQLLVPNIVLDQFKNISEYKNFVTQSSAKENLEEKYIVNME